MRPKIGFCNCDSGVADDDEVDRVADLDLISQRFVPREPGDVIRVADMPGRIRGYDLNMSDGSRRTAVGIAVSRRCDLLGRGGAGQGAARRSAARGAGISRDARHDALDECGDGWKVGQLLLPFSRDKAENEE